MVKTHLELRTYFFEAEWYEVLDFIEFVASNYKKRRFKEDFIQFCNVVLEREMSAYRFVGDTIAQITEREEIEEIDQALESDRGPVRTHLRRSLELLSDRTAPDYRNSVKDSISAVESLAGEIVGEKRSLGALIKKLGADIGLHPALQTAVSSLYGYTSDAGGIRHGIMDADKIDFEDAKFFLVVCSAFINLVDGKST